MQIIPYRQTIYKGKTFIFHTEIIGLDFDDEVFDKIIKELPTAKKILVKVISEEELEVFTLAGSVRKPKKVKLDKKPKIKL